MGDLGSSTNWWSTNNFDGFLDPNINNNPSFYNWNVVYFPYCDGTSFAGNLNKPLNYQNYNLYFEGIPSIHFFNVNVD